MTTAQIITLIVAVAAHAGWITALLHSSRTRLIARTSAATAKSASAASTADLQAWRDSQAKPPS